MSANLTDRIVEWKSKRLQNKKNKPPITANHSFSSKLRWMNNSRITVEFKKRSYSKKDKVTFTLRNVVSVFIVYKLHTWSRDLNADFTLKYGLFEAVKLTTNPDPYKFLILDIVLGLLLVHFFYFQILIGVKTLLFLE